MWATRTLSTYPQHGPVDPVGNRDVIHQVHRPKLPCGPLFDPQISQKTRFCKGQIIRMPLYSPTEMHRYRVMSRSSRDSTLKWSSENRHPVKAHWPAGGFSRPRLGSESRRTKANAAAGCFRTSRSTRRCPPWPPRGVDGSANGPVLA
jgi:hypothetical protein